jgi:hypothetical protein
MATAFKGLIILGVLRKATIWNVVFWGGFLTITVDF